MLAVEVFIPTDIAHSHAACITVLVRDDVWDFLGVVDSADEFSSLD